MKLAIGIILFVLGAATAAGAFAFNSSTPLQLGPIPVFGGGFIALVGLIMAISAL